MASPPRGLYNVTNPDTTGPTTTDATGPPAINDTTTQDQSGDTAIEAEVRI